jgi:hypothetical protein
MLFKIIINLMSNFRTNNEMTMLIKLSIFKLINVNEIFFSFKLLMKFSRLNKEFLTKRFSCYWVMNNSHAHQSIYRIRISLFVENDVKKTRCSKIICRKRKSMIMKKMKKLAACENINE